MDIYVCIYWYGYIWVYASFSIFRNYCNLYTHMYIHTYIPAQKPLNKYPQQEKSKKTPKRKCLHTSVCVHKYPQQGNSKKIPNQNPKP